MGLRIKARKPPTANQRIISALGSDYAMMENSIYGLAVYHVKTRERIYRNPATRKTHDMADAIIKAIGKHREKLGEEIR